MPNDVSKPEHVARPTPDSAKERKDAGRRIDKADRVDIEDIADRDKQLEALVRHPQLPHYLQMLYGELKANEKYEHFCVSADGSDFILVYQVCGLTCLAPHIRWVWLHLLNLHEKNIVNVLAALAFPCCHSPLLTLPLCTSPAFETHVFLFLHAF